MSDTHLENAINAVSPLLDDGSLMPSQTAAISREVVQAAAGHIRAAERQRLAAMLREQSVHYNGAEVDGVNLAAELIESEET